MKDITNKFDHIPQEFDREVIWEGIKKPSGKFIRFPYLWILAGFIVATLSILLLLNEPDRSTAEQQTQTPSKLIMSSNQVASFPGEPEDTSTEENTEPIKNKTNVRSETTNVKSFKINQQQIPLNITSSISSVNNTQDDEKSKQEYIESTSVYKIKQGDSDLDRALLQSNTSLSELPLSSTKTIATADPILSLNNLNIKKKPTLGRQSLAIRVSIGRHSTDFSSGTEDLAAIRQQLESSQFDIGLGIRYEYMFSNHFLLAFTGSYRLYKDKINTTHIRQEQTKEIIIDYNLYNHYHTFSGRLEGGKRFYSKNFFWDIQGGLGLRIHQISEVDYFVGPGELAKRDIVNSQYDNNFDTFFTAQAAVGKYLDNGLFIRLGAQINSAQQLTRSNTDIKHSIIPVNAFVELGMPL